MERSRILAEKEALETAYKNLVEEHRVLQSRHEDVIAEKDDAVNRLRDFRREADDKRRTVREDLRRHRCHLPVLGPIAAPSSNFV